MLASQILHKLPGSLRWMVLFDLYALRRMVPDSSVRKMFGLSEEADLASCGHVVLTSSGPLLAPREGCRLVRPDGALSFLPDDSRTSLYERFSDRFDLFPVDEADCLAAGEVPPLPPVVLYLRVAGRAGEAEAVFAAEPSGEHYELLKAVGVEYLGGRQEGRHYVARFRNRLPTHVHAGELAGFSRTGHCNLFFLRHGSIDRTLERGLLEASSERVSWAARRARETVRRLCENAEDLALTCYPPPPAGPFAYGDTVPLGFLLRAVDSGAPAHRAPGGGEAGAQARVLLRRRRQGPFWAYHTGGLPTSTDSALVLQGFRDPEGVEALEAFADGRGGYYPQLWSPEREPGKMRADEKNAHWCRPDFATTCLVGALRAEAGLQTRTGVKYLEDRFETRGGLYFANPYLVDWVLARALAERGTPPGLRERLVGEILSSINADYSFGRYDVPLSTALAILSLVALGHRSRTVRLAQLRLMDFMGPDGAFPGGTPFYSTLAVHKERLPAGVAARAMLGGCYRQVISTGRRLFETSLYSDGRGEISTPLAALALLAPCSPAERDVIPPGARGEPHPRYRCAGPVEYIQEFALPPYLDGKRNTNLEGQPR